MNTEDHQPLTLGLGFSSSPLKLNTTHDPTHHPGSKPQRMLLGGDHLHEPSLTLSLSGGGDTCKEEKKVVMAAMVGEEPPCSVVSAAASSLSNVVVSVKREREATSSDDMDVERGGSSRISDEDEDGTGPSNTTRKKLRLTKEQSNLLEDSFKQQSTLNPKQKQALADRLNLRPRQVEVWFQNRRARTKLKQTEVDCEYLKKCCENLTDENSRLRKELQELKALKLAQPFYMHLPAATLTMCPSCERIGAGIGVSTTIPATPATNNTAPKSAFTMAAPKSHFYTASPNRPLLVDK